MSPSSSPPPPVPAASSRPTRPALNQRYHTTDSATGSPSSTPSSADSLTRATSLSLPKKASLVDQAASATGSNASTIPDATTQSADATTKQPEAKRQYTATGNERVFPMRNVVHARPSTSRTKTSIGAPYNTSISTTASGATPTSPGGTGGPASPQSPQAAANRASYLLTPSPARPPPNMSMRDNIPPQPGLGPLSGSGSGYAPFAGAGTGSNASGVMPGTESAPSSDTVTTPSAGSEQMQPPTWPGAASGSPATMAAAATAAAGKPGRRGSRAGMGMGPGTGMGLGFGDAGVEFPFPMPPPPVSTSQTGFAAGRAKSSVSSSSRTYATGLGTDTGTDGNAEASSRRSQGSRGRAESGRNRVAVKVLNIESRRAKERAVTENKRDQAGDKNRVAGVGVDEEEGDTYWILGGEPALEEEALHRPSRVQNFGVVMVLEEDDVGNFVVRQVSENCGEILLLSPHQLFSVPSVTGLFSPDSVDLFLDAVDALDDADTPEASAESGADDVDDMDDDERKRRQEQDEADDELRPSAVALPHPEHFKITFNDAVLSPMAPPPPQSQVNQDSRVVQNITRSYHCALHRPDPTRSRDKRLVLELELVDDVLHLLKRDTNAPPLSGQELDSDRRIFDEQLHGQSGDQHRLRHEQRQQHQAAIDPAGPAGTPTPGSETAGTRDAYFGEHDAERTTGPSGDPSAEEIYRSTMSLMKPLRALSKRRSRREPEINMVQLVFQIEEQLRKAKTLDTFLSVTAGIFKELTGFDRAMVVQFDEDWNGRCVAEVADRTRSKDLFLDLTFPAADIASASLAKCKLSLLYNRDAPPVQMCAPTKEAIERPIDMTRCMFRAQGHERLRYLAQMGVRSSMSVSLFAFSKLWGTVTLFSHGAVAQRVSVPIRNLCAYLGESLSRTIERLSYERRLQARRIINTSASSEGPPSIVSKGEDLLELFNSDFGCLSVGEEAKILGEVSNAQEILAVLEYLRAQCFTTVQMSQEISADYPDCRAPDPLGFKQIAGMLVVPLSPLGLDFIVFFRKGTPQEVRWAGSRPDHPTQHGIEIWRQVSAGKSKPWDDEVAETAEVLGVIYSRFINVWREKESAVQANSVTSLLLANASHEVRTPLNAVVNFLELAMDASNSADGVINDNLQKTHDATRSLVHVINDLLDLTRHESGGDLFVQEPFDIRATIEDAISIQRVEAKRKGLSLEVIEDPQGTPPIIVGDRSKVRQIIATSVGNAVKYTTTGQVIITYGELADDVSNAADAQKETDLNSALVRKDSIRIGITITDTGKGIEDDQLEALFSALHHIKQDDRSRVPIGLGLAVSARIVENLGGQMRVESKVGAGSKFTFIIPFGLPDSASSLSADDDSTRSPLERRNSAGSGDSGGSRDSKRSEIESLISAISATHLERRRMSNKARGGAGGTLSRPRSFVSHADLQSGGVSSSTSRTVSARASVSDLAASGGFGSSVSQTLSSLLSAPTSLAPPVHIANPSSPLNPSGSSSPSFTTTPSPLSEPARLPSVPRKAIVESHVPLVPVQPPKRKTFKILVVDDERINRTLIERRLQKDAHQVHLCEHGGLAVQAMEEDPTFDLILMDLNMPICDGYEAASIIRQTEAKYIYPPGTGRPRSHVLNRGVPIIAVSANIHERDRPRLIASGIDGWMVKPVRFDRLRQLMAGVLDPEQRRKDLYRPGELEAGGWYGMRRERS